MQDGRSAFNKREGEIRRHKNSPSERGKVTISKNHIPVLNRMEASTPIHPPTHGRLKVIEKAKVPKCAKV